MHTPTWEPAVCIMRYSTVPDWEPTPPSAYVDYSRIHPDYLRHPELPHWHHFNHPPSPLLRPGPKLNPPQRRTPVTHHKFYPLPGTQLMCPIGRNPSERRAFVPNRRSHTWEPQQPNYLHQTGQWCGYGSRSQKDTYLGTRGQRPTGSSWHFRLPFTWTY